VQGLGKRNRSTTGTAVPNDIWNRQWFSKSMQQCWVLYQPL